MIHISGEPWEVLLLLAGLLIWAEVYHDIREAISDAIARRRAGEE